MLIQKAGSVYCRLLASRNINAATNLTNLTFKRGVRAMRKIFRDRIPQYKINLSKLPPLTKLLTQTNDHELIGSLEQLKLSKLNIYKQHLPAKHNTILLEALFEQENDIHTTLQIIDANLEAMNSFYLGIAFELLDDFVRCGQCDRLTIFVSPELRRLCKKTIYKIRFFEADELLKLIKCLASLKVGEETLIVQATLQMIRHSINDFNVDELDMLSECMNSLTISNSNETNLLMALKRAIPLAKRQQIDSKLFLELNAKNVDRGSD